MIEDEQFGDSDESSPNLDTRLARDIELDRSSDLELVDDGRSQTNVLVIDQFAKGEIKILRLKSVDLRGEVVDVFRDQVVEFILFEPFERDDGFGRILRDDPIDSASDVGDLE